jgi:hypothetical protein
MIECPCCALFGIAQLYPRRLPRPSPAGAAAKGRFCSLIPGLGVKHSTIILAGPTVLSAVGACPPHDGVRRRWWIMLKARVADPCVSGKPLVRCAAVRTVGPAEQHGGCPKCRGFDVSAGEEWPPGNRATDHRHSHRNAPVSAVSIGVLCTSTPAQQRPQQQLQYRSLRPPDLHRPPDLSIHAAVREWPEGIRFANAPGGPIIITSLLASERIPSAPLHARRPHCANDFCPGWSRLRFSWSRWIRRF